MGENPQANPLFMNIKPPSALPNFIATPSESESNEQNKAEPAAKPVISPEIPASKNTVFLEKALGIDGGQSSNVSKDEAQEEPSISDLMEHLSDEQNSWNSGSLLGWVKDAMSSNILHKVAETAKSSVDSIVTTLDPQMKEYIYSGGGTEIIVASDKEDKIRPIREAFQEIFGRATVTGREAQAKNIAAQPIGFEAAVFACQERVAEIQSKLSEKELHPVVALENFIAEILPNQWFDLGLLFLADNVRGINIKVLTQMTPIPDYIITNLKMDTPQDYQFKDTGFSVTIGQVMGTNLNVNRTEWHKVYTSVARTEMIHMAAKSLASIYKQSICEQMIKKELP